MEGRLGSLRTTDKEPRGTTRGKDSGERINYRVTTMSMNSKQAKKYRNCEALDKEFELLEQHLAHSNLPLTAKKIAEIHEDVMNRITRSVDTGEEEE